MEQDVENSYRAVCSTCLSSDRNLISINSLTHVYEVFRLLMYDFAGDRFGEQIPDIEQLICWECLALMRRFFKFKQQVQSAQEHLRVLAMSESHEMDHTYMSQSLSSLIAIMKNDYDKIFFDYTTENVDPWPQLQIRVNDVHDVKDEQYDVAQAVRENINLDVGTHILEVPDMDLQHQMTGIMSMSHIVVNSESLVASDDIHDVVKGEFSELTSISPNKIEMITSDKNTTINDVVKTEKPTGRNYVTEFMTEADMLACREEAKLKVQYASSIYKCELCIIGFYNQTQVEEHFVNAHRGKPGQSPCKVCYVYIDDSKLPFHVEEHYTRHVCKLCGHNELGARLMQQHVRTHLTKQPTSGVIKIGDVNSDKKKGKKRKEKQDITPSTPPKPGDLRRLLSKTTIEGYPCLECDMFFKNSRARKNHVARYHREGLQCDHCKKRFVNRTTLATHLRLHEGPLPRKECYICHKMVRVIQLKYHIQRHQNKSRYECTDCNKVFSHIATYQAHLKYSRAHATDQVFKFPCPMCNKGYPTKEAMQDHFNYQHLGKTSHKCPVCEKPIASRANVEKHMMRVHAEKKAKPRNHVCQTCGKAFTDKKALTQHEVIHSTERPLSCDLCQQTFRQKASLYTHRKRVHKMFPNKRVVQFMDRK